MTTDKIIEKIQKLLALSESSYPEEAASAMAKAQALIQQHNLEMSQIQTAQNRGADYINQVFQVGRFTWNKALMGVLCKYNFCTTVSQSGTSSIYIIGEKYNIEIVEYLYTYVMRELATMQTTSYLNSDRRIDKLVWRESFFFGAIESIMNRMEEQKRAFEAASNESRALIVVKDDELKAASQKFFPKTKQLAAKKIYLNNAHVQGREAGNRVSLNKAING